MANSKISALTSATTPLAGTETLPIVQSSTTKQVSVANLTAGRAVSTGDLTSSGFLKATTNITTIGWGANLAGYYATNGAGAYRMGLARYDTLGSLSALLSSYAVVGIESGATGGFGTGTLAGTFSAGNYIPATAAKGVNFTANTPAAGMTSQLLNWYEEGTWTPAQGSGLTVVGAFSSGGKYTRVGRQVTITGFVKGATSIAVNAATQITNNLPYTSNDSYYGAMGNDNLTVSGVVITSAAILYSNNSIGATPSIGFSVTYTV